MDIRPVYKKLSAFLLPLAAGQLFFSGRAFAGSYTIGEVVNNFILGTQNSQPIFPALCYLFGLFIGVWAIAKLYEHVQNPQQVPIWEFIKKTLVAGCLFGLPIIVEVVHNTFMVNANSSDKGLVVDGWAGATTGGGLDKMVVALMNDSYKPVGNMLMMFCYFAGIVLVIIGIMRLMKSAQEGPRGPGGFGTIMTFLVAGILLSADEMMAVFSRTLFTTSDVDVTANLTFSAGLTAVENDHVMAVISAVLAFVMILGWISFIRGWFIIREVAEGSQQASLMAGMTHLFGGALAINLGPVLNAAQETFGLAAIGVNFS
ncbi:MAG: hypothetical protein CO093_04810 [Alphaproteobacteria bacterium CG_4_9_14_3_um_filter_47_13]|nr:MAG: hypothetical protein CO093_04810 [Alphaproteobacteria bacterium CG_4_9_14_3_um_filter_47_13]